MTYATALSRLWNHSNLPRTEGRPEESLVFCLYHAGQSKVPPKIDDLIDDVLRCLTTVNLQLNGAVPSESTRPANLAVIQDVAYPMSGIVSACLRYHRKWQRQSLFSPQDRDVLYEGTSRIAFAWDQVLAGDIDDILEGFEAD